ncbi:hypothetical protein [Rhizobium sophorae]|nr:hypothetical protein [Rhizobium sophorae]
MLSRSSVIGARSASLVVILFDVSPNPAVSQVEALDAAPSIE